jgi:GNAT superfamily N-acetyltransferase
MLPSDTGTSPPSLLTAHDIQVRASIEQRMPSGWRARREGEVLLVRTPQRGFVFTGGLIGAGADEVAAQVTRARTFFAARGESFEWKVYGHDNAALVGALRAAGFVPEPTETVLVAETVSLAREPRRPAGITLRTVSSPADLGRIAELESRVWDADWSWLADDLAERIRDGASVYVAEAGGEIVSAGWLVPLRGTTFAGLWGGATVTPWRGRGVYRALVAARATAAAARGFAYLWVDASDDSRPTLERLGMTAVTTTTPWIWHPDGS